MGHVSPSEKFPHTMQSRTRARASWMARARAAASSGGLLRMWNARRVALFCPIPGKSLRASISRPIGSANPATLASPGLEQPGDLQSPGEAADLLLQRLVHLARRVVHG